MFDRAQTTGSEIMTRSQKESYLTAFLRCLRLSVALLTITTLICLPVHCYADVVEPPEKTTVEQKERVISGVCVGIAGVYKNGFQTQIVVSLEPGERSEAIVLELETRDTDGAPFAFRREATRQELSTGKVELSFVLPKSSGKLTIRAIAHDSVVDEQTFEPSGRPVEGLDVVFGEPASPARPVYLVVGDDKAGFAEAFAELRLKEERRPIVVKMESLEQLPNDYRSYEAIDRVFLTTTDVSLYEGYGADSEKFVALERWVETGGNVVIFAGKDSVGLLSDGGALSGLSPGKSVAAQTHEFRVVNALINELQNVKNLAMTGTRSNPFLRAPVLSELKEGANVEMQEAETPLLVSRAVGLGTTIFFAADLASAPIANWSGRSRLMLKILGIDPDDQRAREGSANVVKRGYVDYSGQIRSALDRFNGVRLVPFTIVAIMLFVYVLAIAPLDWALVKKIIKKPMATWATFPFFVLLFAVIAVWIFKARTPKEEMFNQLDVIDVDMASGSVRDVSWIGFYSPVGNRYDLSFKPALSGLELVGEATSTVAPLPLSGAGLGGAEQKTYTPRLWNEPYRVEEGSLRNIPMSTRSSKSFVGRWTGRVKGLPQTVELSDDTLSLRGSVVNPFDVPIYSAYIVYQGGACALGTLPPGETRIDRGAARIEPMRVINEQRSSVPNSRSATWDSNTYNSASVRLPYILRAATFYDYGGGVDNFGIEKRLQRDVDLSALLRCGRAVVYGVIVDPECEEYKPTGDLARISADAVEIERLNKKIAEQKGEEYRDTRAETLKKYGFYGTSPDFKASDTQVAPSRKGEDFAHSAASRTVVARLIVPIRFGPHAPAEK